MSAVRTGLVWLALLLVGGVGAVLRLLIDTWINRIAPGRLPYGTLVINLSGAFVLGLLDGLALSPDTALIVGSGLIGAYTTFSTWMFETQRLGEERQFSPGLTNVWLSMAAGVALAGLGLWVGGGL